YKHVSKFGSYERLEFLGDAILEYLIVRYLYDHSSNLNRGEIAQYRGKFTSNETLACLTLKHGLQKYILHNSKKKIDQKCYADIFESLAGAVYVDSGMDLDVTWKDVTIGV
uniref:RNase III domain-containing protein n=1 Tax=Panagrolaimus sp. ES5 TaxID=591445 RepID=A0AC34GFJ9_9BILA